MRNALMDLLVLFSLLTGLAAAPAGEIGRIPTENTTALEMTHLTPKLM